MKYTALLDRHPNFKHILKNRILRNPNYPFEFQIDNLGLSGGYCSSNVFVNARGRKVFLRTKAGDIEVFEKDFQ